jgi:4-amino-4-deoxy-L-arabinose transferase-like glycosyltransferase
MAALSFRVFGINGFAYKLPALLFWGAGAWYTFRFANLIYGKSIAQLSTLVYVSAAHLVISNNDVRAEPYLTGLVIGSVFHFYQASRARTSLVPPPRAAPLTFVGASSLAPPRPQPSLRSLAAGPPVAVLDS